jgi:hypothetical protein
MTTNKQYLEFLDKLNSDSNIELATEYHEYMEFRAANENLKHELDIKFYAINLAKGCPFFFGVYHDGDHITHDTQKPNIFKKWKKLNN